MKSTFLICVVVSFLALDAFCQNQVKVDTNVSVEGLIKSEFLMGGLEVSNIKYSGSLGAIGLFSCSSDSFPLSKGILLSTGKAKQIIGPNNNFGTSGVNNTDGDADLNVICNGKTLDATIIEFDFIPSSENMAFDFIFASEEYTEYVDTDFNDVFAFIVTKVSTGEKFNIAYLPKTNDPITVNNVNLTRNANYYIDNKTAGTYYFINGVLEMDTPHMFGEGKKADKLRKANAPNRVTTKCKTLLCKMIQYDGFTKVLTAKAKVEPDQLYHFKIAIADVHDQVYDSGVILRAHSLKSYDRYGIIKGDTSGFIVQDDDLEKIVEVKPKEKVKAIEKKEKVNYKFTPVYFDYNSASISDNDLKMLDSLAKVLIKDSMRKVTLSAHTDSDGNDSYNVRLSIKRGEAVKRKLEKAGVSSGQIQVEYFGESKPKEDNTFEKGRGLNRRVEILIK